jgi:phosphoglycerol transferase MdoB-like AlkP superfamily enzyme
MKTKTFHFFFQVSGRRSANPFHFPPPLYKMLFAVKKQNKKKWARLDALSKHLDTAVSICAGRLLLPHHHHNRPPSPLLTAGFLFFYFCSLLFSRRFDYPKVFLLTSIVYPPQSRRNSRQSFDIKTLCYAAEKWPHNNLSISFVFFLSFSLTKWIDGIVQPLIVITT